MPVYFEFSSQGVSQEHVQHRLQEAPDQFLLIHSACSWTLYLFLYLSEKQLLLLGLPLPLPVQHLLLQLLGIRWLLLDGDPRRQGPAVLVFPQLLLCLFWVALVLTPHGALAGLCNHLRQKQSTKNKNRAMMMLKCEIYFTMKQQDVTNPI